MTQIAEAEKYAERSSRFYPVRITDTKTMEVVRVYLKKETPQPTLEQIMDKFRKEMSK